MHELEQKMLAFITRTRRDRCPLDALDETEREAYAAELEKRGQRINAEFVRKYEPPKEKKK